MNLKTMLASVVAVLMLTACEDLFEDGSLQPDGSNPSVTINAPTGNQSLTRTQGLRVNITAVDKDKVKDMEFTVRGTTSEKDLFTFKKFPEKNVIEFDTLVSLGTVTPGSYILTVKATDKRTNVTSQDVNFTVK
ncbi:Ig-like domain-containing protein [Pontibacter vulgaris]|uniref:Ig-like domain-containing protein n=1 Tax=Pontibacter vulgaris TaxID=2905679 RepID=UPI001FA787CC|nr:Ig-like domain-containing protein [Pontibacter vulgaris]